MKRSTLKTIEHHKVDQNSDEILCSSVSISLMSAANVNQMNAYKKHKRILRDLTQF